MAKKGTRLTFHGSYTDKVAARIRESRVPGSFILHRGDRYLVMTRNPATKHKGSPSRSYGEKRQHVAKMSVREEIERFMGRR